MTNVLILFEVIPETLNMYLIQADEDTVKILETAHGCYVNGKNTPEQDYAVTAVNLMLGSRNDDNLEWAHTSGIPHELVGMYEKCETPLGDRSTQWRRSIW